MKIQLFNPPVHHYSGVHYRMNPPLGLPILAAVLEQAGHSAEVWDLEALTVGPRKLAQAFGKQQAAWPDAVGFTVTNHNARGTRESIEALRGVGYDRPILVGGPQVMLEPDGWDAIAVVGECEGNIAAIMDDSVKRGVLSGYIAGEPMPIEDIPAPLWSKHLPKPREYDGNMPKVGHPESISMWSRGCPHRCLFCSNPLYKGQRIRYRSPESVRAELETLKRMGIRALFVYDDELVQGFGAHQRWLVGVCEAIRDLGLLWKCQGRCSTKIEPDTLKAMYDAGCRAIMWGVESFSDKILRAIKKDTTETDIWHTLETASAAGIGNWLFLMVGNYQETPQDLAYTASRLKQARDRGLVQWVQCTVCTPEPGTELYDLANAEGWYVEPPQSGPQMNQVYAPTPWLTEWDLRHWQSVMRRMGKQ